MTDANNLLALINQRKAQVSRQKTIKPENGRNRYRILPSWNPASPKFWADFGQHFVKDKTGKVLAVYVCADKTFGKPCEVCGTIHHAMKHAEDDHTIKMMKDALGRGNVLLNVLWLSSGGKVRDDEPQVLEIPPSAFNGHKGVGGILSLFDEWPNLLDLANGMDIVIEKQGTAMDTRYGVTIANGGKPVNPEVMKKITDLDKFVMQESEEGKTRALTAISQVSGAPQLPAPPSGGGNWGATTATTANVAAANASIAANLDAEQEAALRVVEGSYTPAVETVQTTQAPAAPAAPAQPAPPPAQPAVTSAAETAPAATAVASTGDDELDKLLADL